jgi:microcystin-dependent protein
MAIAIDGAGTVTGVNILQTAGVPAGAIMAFAMNSAPSGWLSADGSAVSRTTYATLFAAVGTTHGTGDGSTTFNVPNLQGIFVRASGSQTISGTSYSGTFAAKQQDELKSHKHQSWEQLVNTSGQLQCAQSTQAGTGKTAASSTNTDFATADTGGTETRPANIALLHCIKT